VEQFTTDTVVKAESVNSLKGRLDRFWNDQEVKYNWKADTKGTGSRSNLVQILFYNIKFLCMQFLIIPDIEAIRLRPLELVSLT